MRQKTEEELAAITEKRRRTLINILYFGFFFALSVVLVRYALKPLLPFIVAYVVTVILNPLVKLMEKKLRMDRRRLSVVLVLLFYCTIGVALVFIAVAAFDGVKGLVSKIPSLYSENIYPALNAAFDKVNELIEKVNLEQNIDVADMLGKAVSTITQKITEFSTTKAPSMAISLTGFLLNTIIAIISTAFLLMDYDMICSFIHHQLPEKTSEMVKVSTSHLRRVLGKYIVSYGIILFITFSEIFLGLSIIGVEGAVAIAILVAVFDILPIVGSGMVMFPWAVIELIIGHYGRGLGLLILWAVVVIVRQIIEPKIVGNTVGMHPFLTLFAMLAGNFIYGGIGVLLLPVMLALIQSLNEAHIIHIYSRLKKEDREKVKDSPLTIWFKKMADKVFSWIKKLFVKIKNLFVKKK